MKTCLRRSSILFLALVWLLPVGVSSAQDSRFPAARAHT
jgi:hypothetical protein